MSSSAQPTTTTATAPAGAARRPPVDSSPLRGSDPARIGGYRLVARLGAGGMADVFYSVAPTGRPVAVKVLRPTGGGRAACHREYELARAGAGCTAPALGYGSSPAGSYLVTAYLPGYRCGTTLTDRPATAPWLWGFGAALARVLTTLHARGVVHCDVKPSNLLVHDHDVRVIDFGISRYVDEPSRDDRTVECSPGWAAPEQLRTAPPTPAVDVFAWGCVLAYLASGVRPFASRDGQEWYQRLQSAEPDLLGLPPVLADVVRWSLARSPRDRPHAAELTEICQKRANDGRGGSGLSPPRPPQNAKGRGYGDMIEHRRPAGRRLSPLAVPAPEGPPS